MNLTLYKHNTLSILLVVLLVLGCNKEIEESEQFSPVFPESLDENAGSWEMKVLASPEQITIDEALLPKATTDPTYLTELASVKEAQSKLTGEQRSIIEYWSAGGVLRWNQFMRELVARYSLPPAPKDDDTYPVPDAENPFADPAFPFANPPYAARAYSYVSVGQYEALKVAWYYKNIYERPAPYETDSEIQSLMPKTSAFSFPSEDAVLSGVSVEMLKALFPAAVREITLKAAEQRNAALWSGKATKSDIDAGLSIGKKVAAEMMKRAGNDNMKTAGGNKTLWKKLEDDCAATGEIPWKSQDNPARPPMLPAFGKVSAWNMTTDDITNERPAPPPSTSSEEMKKQLEEVKYYVDNTTRERLRIVQKWADGAGTYTPPGHWNDIAAEYIHAAKFSEVRAARAFALLNMALHDAAVGCWETKFFYFNPRPHQLDPSIKTYTGLPNFPAYTSGHSTFSGSAATVLSYLFPEHSDYFFAEASEASLSRLYGGIHFRADIEMGMAHGKVIGGYTVEYGQSDGADD